jgi:hypothetical protein
MGLESGSRLGPYEVVGLLGSRGMGEVYLKGEPLLDSLCCDARSQDLPGSMNFPE